MQRRSAHLVLIVVLGMFLGGCVLDLTSPEALERSLRDAERSFQSGDGPGFGPGTGSDPDGMATGGSGGGSGGSGGGGGSGPPPDGWPPDAGPGPSAPPSDSFSDPDGTTYGEYEFDNLGPEWRRTQNEIHDGLARGGYEREGPAVSTEGGFEYTYTNSDTGGTAQVEYASRDRVIRTTYIP